MDYDQFIFIKDQNVTLQSQKHYKRESKVHQAKVEQYLKIPTLEVTDERYSCTSSTI